MENAYGLKSLIENLFGNKAWLEIKHAADITTWRKYSIRIVQAIRFSADTNVLIADSKWHKELSRIADFGIDRMKQAKTLEELFSNLSATLAQLSFLQLGRVPSNCLRKQVTLRHAGNWKLNQYRTVQYIQDKHQAANLEAHNDQIKKGVRLLQS